MNEEGIQKLTLICHIIFTSLFIYRDKFRLEKDKMPPEKRTLVLTHFPRFLSLLEEEIYSTKSPIWDVDFRQAPPPHVGTYLIILFLILKTFTGQSQI